MPARPVVLAALIASCVSSAIIFTLGLLVAVLLFQAPRVEAQTPGPPTSATPTASPGPQATPTVTLAPPVVRAGRFELVGSDGRVQAVLGAEAGLVGLVVRGQGEAWRVGAGMLPGEQPMMAISDELGVSRIVLSMLQNAAVELHDPAGGLAAALVATGYGDSYLTLGDHLDDRARLIVEADGTAIFRLGQPEGAGLTLGAGRGLSGMGVRDANGSARIGLGVQDSGTSTLFVRGDDGQPLWQAP